jgi:hypothetical protein
MLVNERWPLWQIARYLNNFLSGLTGDTRTHWPDTDQEALIYFSEW